MSPNYVELVGSSGTVAQLRAHHQQALQGIARIIASWLHGAAVSIWDAETDVRVVEHGNGHARISYALAASMTASFETYRRATKRPTLSLDERGCVCIGVGLKFATMRRAGGVIAMQPKGAQSWGVETLNMLHEFAGIIEAQCELFDTVMRLRLEGLDVAARIASAGFDGFAGALADGAVARCLPRGAVCIFDDTMRYVVADGEALVFLGGLPRERMQGFTVEEVTPFDDLARLAGIYRNVLAGKTYRADLAHDKRGYEALAVPIHNLSGAVVAGAVLVQDVTRLRDLEVKLAGAPLAILAMPVPESPALKPSHVA